jgi:hypothetical protein
MNKPTTLQDIFNNSYESIVNDDGTSSERFNEDLAKQAILDLLESKAQTLSTVEKKEPLLYGFVPVRAIPLTALRELEGK